MDDLITRLTAAIDEDEMAARAALAGYPPAWGYEGCEPATMSSVWQASYHEVFQVMTEEPSAGYIARHRPDVDVGRLKRTKVVDCGPANVYPAQHIARHGPASVLRGCTADRKIMAIHRPIETFNGLHIEVQEKLGRAVSGVMICERCANNDKDYGWDDHDEDVQYPCPTLRAVAERYGLEVQGG